VKAEAERQLGGNGLRRLFIARPGYIRPAGDRAGAFTRAMFPVLNATAPGLAITADELARGLIEAALGDAVGGILRTRDLKRLATPDG
jgi:hypothetical protein